MSALASQDGRVESETVGVAVDACGIAHVGQELAPESSWIVPPSVACIVVGYVTLKTASRRQVAVEAALAARQVTEELACSEGCGRVVLNSVAALTNETDAKRCVAIEAVGST